MDDELRTLKAPPILISAAREGRITALECAMPECVCPDGRGHFERTGTRSPWAPSADQWPVPKRDGGTYQADNVRLAHRRCNTLDGTRVTQEHLRENGYYGSPKHRETGRRLGLGRREGMREWWKTPAGQAVRAANAQRLREHNPSRDRVPDPTGRQLAEWRERDPAAAREAVLASLDQARAALAQSREAPEVRAALVEQGRQLGLAHGSAALENFRRSPKGREMAQASGERLAALAKSRAASGYFATPEQARALGAKGKVGACRRWNVERGKPCVCGAHND